jgi:hypothetical protein
MRFKFYLSTHVGSHAYCSEHADGQLPGRLNYSPPCSSIPRSPDCFLTITELSSSNKLS